MKYLTLDECKEVFKDAGYDTRDFDKCPEVANYNADLWEPATIGGMYRHVLSWQSVAQRWVSINSNNSVYATVVSPTLKPKNNNYAYGILMYTALGYTATACTGLDKPECGVNLDNFDVLSCGALRVQGDYLWSISNLCWITYTGVTMSTMLPAVRAKSVSALGIVTQPLQGTQALQLIKVTKAQINAILQTPTIVAQGSASTLNPGEINDIDQFQIGLVQIAKDAGYIVTQLYAITLQDAILNTSKFKVVPVGAKPEGWYLENNKWTLVDKSRNYTVKSSNCIHVRLKSSSFIEPTLSLIAIKDNVGDRLLKFFGTRTAAEPTHFEFIRNNEKDWYVETNKTTYIVIEGERHRVLAGFVAGVRTLEIVEVNKVKMQRVVQSMLWDNWAMFQRALSIVVDPNYINHSKLCQTNHYTNNVYLPLDDIAFFYFEKDPRTYEPVFKVYASGHREKLRNIT